MAIKKNKEQEKYFSIHEPRFIRLLNIVEEMDLGKDARILDVGPSFLTGMLRNNFPHANVYTLGIVGNERDGGHLPKGVLEVENHTEYNLNQTSEKGTWPSLGKFDLIICAEVIEHIHTAPEYIFQFFKSLTRPGSRLIIQTPNAAALIKRLTLLTGKNPYERIRLNSENPGHFREYTTAELIEIAESESLTVQSITVNNYFRQIPVTWKVRSYHLLQKILGENFRDGITLICKAVLH